MKVLHIIPELDEDGNGIAVATKQIVVRKSRSPQMSLKMETFVTPIERSLFRHAARVVVTCEEGRMWCGAWELDCPFEWQDLKRLFRLDVSSSVLLSQRLWNAVSSSSQQTVHPRGATEMTTADALST